MESVASDLPDSPNMWSGRLRNRVPPAKPVDTVLESVMSSEASENGDYGMTYFGIALCLLSMMRFKKRRRANMQEAALNLLQGQAQVNRRMNANLVIYRIMMYQVAML